VAAFGIVLTKVTQVFRDQLVKIMCSGHFPEMMPLQKHLCKQVESIGEKHPAIFQEIALLSLSSSNFHDHGAELD